MTSDELWKRFEEPLRRFVRSRVRSDAEDLLQEIFVRIHSALPGLRDERRAQSWVFRIARNAIVDHYRAPKSVAPPPEVSPPQPATAGTWISPLVATLSPADREILELADVQGVDDAEIARRLGLSLTAAKSRIARARRRLRAAVDDGCSVELDRRGRAVECVPKRCDCACE